MKLKPNHPDSYRNKLGDHLITERPILFQTEMVQAILEDRKTQTRRVIKPEPESVNTEIPVTMALFNEKMNTLLKKGLVSIRSNTGGFAFPNCKYGKPGDLLWVRETHANLNNGLANSEPFFVYKADLEHPDQHGPVTWKPSIHMPKAASRIWLMVEDVRAEKLQDLSEEDAKNEGIVDYSNPKCQNYEPGAFGFHDYVPQKRRDGKFTHIFHDCFLNPIDSFKSLWVSINGQESWGTNPWVWVIKFRVLSKTGRPYGQEILDAYLSVLASQNRKEVSHV